MLCKKIPWTSVESSFQTGQKAVRQKSAEIFVKTRKNCKSKYFLQKSNFFRKVCCSIRVHLWQIFQSFFAIVAECSAHSRKTVTTLRKFIEKTVQSKISTRHINCSFYEPAENSYRTPKTFSLKFRSKTWIFSED